MSNVLVLISGFPATGKTYLRDLLLDRYASLIAISPDEFKEKLWNVYGFNSSEEKERLVQRAWLIYYEALERAMSGNQDVVCDYPFSEKQRLSLQSLVRAHEYHAVTVRLVGDLDVLYTRSTERDLDDSRNLAHLVTRYEGTESGDKSVDRRSADSFLTRDEFYQRCLTRGYDRFQLGELVVLDVTDYSRIEYSTLFNVLDRLL